ncbi:MAG TPA: hypothetical protein VGU61_03670 [Noviherbaspirillum sp.]|jgi:hypothetical protein|uniref:hypothetical protein n=1 Tax=Noviherbaspirillum sp. TaxID=1926288 RepID=UPI002DDD6641|nr:hypothetical protein [Noviherbaspirillum sp.]HEV2609343.1 hypothetical protein [Noviherbaspirillum sp.]
MIDESSDPPAIADRKEQLIAQGRTFRARVAQSKQALQQGLRPQALAKGAIGHVAPVVLGMVASRGLSGAKGLNLQQTLPLLADTYSALSRRGLIKPALRIAGIAGIVGAVGWMVINRRRSVDADAASSPANTSDSTT